MDEVARYCEMKLLKLECTVQQDAAIQYSAVPCFKHYRYAKINNIILLVYLLILKQLENNESILFPLQTHVSF
jgi:hypothetical protein